MGSTARADDWPQFGGLGRDGVWKETGIIQTFPPGGLKVRWRAPVGSGLSSPIVSDGRVFLCDAERKQPKAWERVHCYDETSGKLLWTHMDEVSYPEWAFGPASETGPDGTPLAAGGKIYAVGRMGNLVCLNALDGAVLWQKDLAKDFGLGDTFGTTPSPLIEGDLLILVTGGMPDACVLAFDKENGKEVWRALNDKWTYSSPIVISAGGKRQLIVWTPDAITSLDPATGKTWWRELRTLHGDFAVATPTAWEGLLLAGGLMFQLDPDQPAASVLWPKDTVQARRSLSNTTGPLLLNGYVYSHKSQGRLVCLDARTGQQVWEKDKVTASGSGACLHLIRNGDGVWLFTDEGDLIRARLTPQGYEELGRAHLLNPTYQFGGRKRLWSPPAFANGHVFARSSEELVCASLRSADR
ncbi:MAG: outer membrane protein assembly factor BamB [Chthoniobacter sp.]|nr:outer membrane protein assembly factor BamB [Chthoniobacter sp.]